MAVFDTTRTAYGSTSAVSRFSALFGGAMASVVAWRDARATRRALSTLTDRELDDIGLVRGDIDVVATSNLIR
tara:strand:+ start:237 stop:455 length:219 start_codon:yes stop_codon:yes gene_type:complete